MNQYIGFADKWVVLFFIAAILLYCNVYNEYVI